MSDKATKTTPAETTQFVPNDIVGAIKQMGHELHQYMNQPVPYIDPAVCMGYLERMAQWTQLLPRPQPAQNGATQPEARAN